MRLATAITAFAGVAVLAAGCGSGGGGGTSSAPAKQATGGAAVVSAKDTGSLGKILVDGNGRTLYLFAKDKGTASTCSGACAQNWPPVTTTGAPQASGGVSSSEIKTVKRSDGAMQVIFAGHPLYYFAGDSAVGDTKGEGVNAFGAAWWALTPAGKRVTTGSGSSGSSSGGGRYGGY